MKIRQRMEGDVYIIEPEGRIEAVTLPELSACIHRIIYLGALKILIDFSETDYINSSGIRTLLEAHNRIVEQGGCIVICSPNDQLMELFRVVHLEKTFPIYKSDFEALDHLMG